MRSIQTILVLAVLSVLLIAAEGGVLTMAKLAEKNFKSINNATIKLTFSKNGVEKSLDFGGR